MKMLRTKVSFFFFILTVSVFLFSSSSKAGSPVVHVIQLEDDTINPVTAEYIINAIDRAQQQQAACLIIKIDTPGGLLSSTRMIVKHMLTATVPIVVYVAPGGSRAGSAGVFITYASHVAAMAPSTNIGAAHPVQMGEAPGQKESGNDWNELKDLIQELKQNQDRQEQPVTDEKIQDDNGGARKEIDVVADDDPMASKILQDTVAFIKAIAVKRGRNVEWGVESVTKSSSITADEALEKSVIDIIAKDDVDLLNQLDGRKVVVNDNEIVLQTKNASIEYAAMDARQKFFNILANPNIAYFLLILGFYGLLYEITHPGFGLPGILGGIFLILAFYSMQTLPTNYAGLALMILGIILLIAEAYTPTFGLLTVGGLISLILGSLLLFKSVDPVMRVSISAILAFSLTTTGITLFLMRSALRSFRAKVKGGSEGLIGEIGEARGSFSKGQKGRIFVHGELWTAIAQEDINNNDEVIVESINGLTLKVRKKV